MSELFKQFEGSFNYNGMELSNYCNNNIEMIFQNINWSEMIQLIKTQMIDRESFNLENISIKTFLFRFPTKLVEQPEELLARAIISPFEDLLLSWLMYSYFPVKKIGFFFCWNFYFYLIRKWSYLLFPYLHVPQNSLKDQHRSIAGTNDSSTKFALRSG